MNALRWLAVLALLVALPGTVAADEPGVRAVRTAAPEAAAASMTVDSQMARELTIDRALARAVRASQRGSFHGQMTVVSFTERGPQVTELDLTRNLAGIELTRDSGEVVGRAGTTAFLRSSQELLRVGGVEPLPAQLGRLLTKYAGALGDTVVLDTGPAVPLRLTERASGIDREVLYLDEATGLIVRRETFSRAGVPLRLVAYVMVETGDEVTGAVHALPPGAGGHRDHARASSVGNAHDAQAATLRAMGFVVPDRLPRGYELLAAREVAGARVPTAHLIYHDGLYSAAVFQQMGTMRRTSVEGAMELQVADGTLWRWPGSEPRRIVWSGDGLTFTLLSDAPTDELLEVVAELPIDPERSTLARLGRGLQQVAGWFAWNDRSET